jgi:hypothetical protein
MDNQELNEERNIGTELGLQSLLMFGQRFVQQVIAVAMQQVERVEVNLSLRASGMLERVEV